MINAQKIVDFLSKRQYEFKLLGNPKVCCNNFSSLKELKDNSITWIKKWTEETNIGIFSKYKNLIIVCTENGLGESLLNSDFCYICTENPKMIFFEIIDNFFAQHDKSAFISDTARIYTKSIGEGCRIGDYCVISEETTIGNYVSIGCNVVTIGKVVIEDHCKIQSGAVIGESGYGYYQLPDGHNKQVAHLGGVVLKHHVEIGANTCIDRGTMGDTIIGEYSKVDNLVHIAHNVQVGADCMIIAGTVLCGSCNLEDRVYIAPGAIVRNQITIAEDTVVGMQALVTKNTEAKSIMMGVPAKKKENHI